jgi:hypothetical protein
VRGRARAGGRGTPGFLAGCQETNGICVQPEGRVAEPQLQSGLRVEQRVEQMGRMAGKGLGTPIK